MPGDEEEEDKKQFGDDGEGLDVGVGPAPQFPTEDDDDEEDSPEE